MTERPSKRAKFLDESSDESDGDAHNRNIVPNLQHGTQPFKINEDYARRFEHNKKREEKHRLEEKYGQQLSESEESSSEDEDDGDLGDPTLDVQFSQTLQALRNKDPRIRDKSYRFFSDIQGSNSPTQGNQTKEKPMTLKDYHRKNLLKGNIDMDEEELPKTYVQEQEDLKETIVKQMHAAAEESDSQESDREDFLVKKEAKRNVQEQKSTASASAALDIGAADKDPETFLSNFLASKAWMPDSGTQWQPFDSDSEDGEGVRQADEFEEAYNMRFEDPTKSNEKLMAFSRETISKYSVRRQEPTGRKKARELEQARKNEERQEREEEKARLRKLKIEEMQQKVQKIKKSAGFNKKDFDLNEWTDVLEADWDDQKWEAEMTRRFGEEYYAAEDVNISEDDAGDNAEKQRKPKKPTWDDDIDIQDIAPDFTDDEDAKAAFTLSDDDNVGDGDGSDQDQDQSGPVNRNTKKARLQTKSEAKKNAKRDRLLIESLVDQSLRLESEHLPISTKQSKAPTQFRYRETSPSTFGLTARDILLASDSQLNQFVGLKKMAAFRDPEKKRKDKKRLGKKARLRQWRRETFGEEDEPKGGFERLFPKESDVVDPSKSNRKREDSKLDSENGSTKKRKRSKKGKATN